MAKQVHVKMFNLEYDQNRKEYEALLSNCLNHPTIYRMCRPPEKIMKTVTRGDLESNESTQEVWLLVEYSVDDTKTKKNDDNAIFMK